MNKIGLGCVTFGREIDEYTSFALMDHAYANGIFSFDTAAVYGGGASEEIIGKWLIKNPEKKIEVATKIIPPFNAASIQNTINLSLSRLNIDRLSILYLHRWDEQLTTPEPWIALEQMVSEGKIGAVGVSNFNDEQLGQTIEILEANFTVRISYLQNNHNFAVSNLNNQLISLCQNHNIKIVTFSPLGAGFLTGKHQKGVASGSRFDLMPAHQSIYFNEAAQERLAHLLAASTFTGHSPALLALSWAIHQPHTHQVLVGGRSTEQLDLAISALKFNDDVLLRLLEEGFGR